MKNTIRDQAAAQALCAWKEANGYTDAQIAAAIGVSVPAVALWRTKATRPMPLVRERLRALVGWDWDAPPGSDYVPASDTPPAPRVERPTEEMAEAWVFLSTLPVRSYEDRRALLTAIEVLEDMLRARNALPRSAEDVPEVEEFISGHENPHEALSFLAKHGTYSPETIHIVSLRLQTQNVRVAV